MNIRWFGSHPIFSVRATGQFPRPVTEFSSVDTVRRTYRLGTGSTTGEAADKRTVIPVFVTAQTSCGATPGRGPVLVNADRVVALTSAAPATAAWGVWPCEGGDLQCRSQPMAAMPVSPGFAGAVGLHRLLAPTVAVSSSPVAASSRSP